MLPPPFSQTLSTFHVWYFALEALSSLSTILHQSQDFDGPLSGAAFGKIRENGDNLIRVYKEHPYLLMDDNTGPAILHKCRLKALWTLDPMYTFAPFLPPR